VRDFPEHFVLFVRSREIRIGSRLAVVIAQVLISRKEPDSIAMQGTAKIRREVPVPVAFISGNATGVSERKHNGLGGQSIRLPIVRRVVGETIAALFRDDVEDGSLDAAVLGGCTDTLNLDFLNGVHAGFGARYALAGAGEVCPVDEKHVLADSGAKRGNRIYGAAGGRGGRNTGSRPDAVEHTVPACRDLPEVFLAEVRFKPAVSRFGAGTGSLDDNRFSYSFYLQFHRS